MTITDQFVKQIASNVKLKANPCTGEGMKKFFVFLDAYNKYQEEEYDGTDYIFNLCEQEDILCCVKGGMTAEDISNLYSIWQSGAITIPTPFFFFGCNYNTPKLIKSWSELWTILVDSLDELIPCVMIHPVLYKEFYDTFVVDMFDE